MAIDRCTETKPHAPHRAQYGPFGVKDCPGVEAKPVSFAEQLVERHGEPMRAELERARVRYEAETAQPSPRRRWWHRYTRKD